MTAIGELVQKYQGTGFTSCITVQADIHKRHTIKCKLGLWSVDAPSLALAVSEALSYYRQYKADGEYHELIGGPTPAQVMLKNMKFGGDS